MADDNEPGRVERGIMAVKGLLDIGKGIREVKGALKGKKNEDD